MSLYVTLIPGIRTLYSSVMYCIVINESPKSVRIIIICVYQMLVKI